MYEGGQETEKLKDPGRAENTWAKDRPNKKGLCRADLVRPGESLISEPGK